MYGVTHATTGAAAYLAGCAAASIVGVHPTPLALVAGTLAAAAGALIPDFDHPCSIASTSVWPASIVLFVAAWYGHLIHRPWWPAAMAFGLVALFPAVVTRAVSRAVYRATATPLDDRRSQAGTHRALTHTWPFALAVGAGWGVTVAIAGLGWAAVGRWWWVGLPLGLGCLVHTCGDWLTKSGVPLLWPMVSHGRRWRRVGAPVRFATGGRAEGGVLACAMVVAVSALLVTLTP